MGQLSPPGSGDSKTLIEELNASAWTVQKSPSPGSSARLSGVAATTPSNAWSVGQTSTRAATSSQTLIEHWDGSAWTLQTSPDYAADGYNSLAGVAATSSKNAWAVGSYYSYSSTGQAVWHTVIERWNGASWRLQTSP